MIRFLQQIAKNLRNLDLEIYYSLLNSKYIFSNLLYFKEKKNFKNS